MKKIIRMLLKDIIPILIFFGIGLILFLQGGIINIDSSSDLILFITFLGLVWYSYETRKTRISSEEQTDLLLTPVVELRMEENEAAAYCFKLKNVGAGLALNIQISENSVICRNKVYKKEDTKMEKVPEFEIPNFLYSGQEEILKPRQKGEDVWWIIKPYDVTNPGMIKIKYENLRGKEFSRSFHIEKRCTDEKGWTYYKVKMKK
jgi:hypothetical protein